jgi:two-component system, NarL family, response regulator NreC
MPDPRETIRVVITDDHRLVRSGLRLLLSEEEDIEVVAEAGDAAAALRLVEELEPDVVLLDLSMPGRSGLEAIPDLLAASPQTHVVVLTMQSDPAFAARAMAAGAAAFVLKECADSELKTAIRASLAGRTYVTPRLAPAMDAAATVVLTPREQEVLRVIALGHTNAEIAELLGLSVRTIESHRAHIAQKVGRSTRAELVRAARELQLLG